jgi:antitoxin (DNA-binding transcriptional repressor) of toxin-antitoxin stability system
MEDGEKETMETVSIEEAQARLLDLIHRLTPGDELVITENDLPVARLVASVPPLPGAEPPRRLGSLRGTVQYMAPDFDAPLDDFKDYME